MWIRLSVIVTLPLLMLINGLVSYTNNTIENDCITSNYSNYDDAGVYNQLQILNGKVSLINAKTGEIDQMSLSQSIIFQRTDCNICLYVTSPDKTGKYELTLSKGTYRVIVRYGSRIGETYDGLHPDQIRTVEVNSPTRYTDFDIRLRRIPHSDEEKFKIND